MALQSCIIIFNPNVSSSKKQKWTAQCSSETGSQAQQRWVCGVCGLCECGGVYGYNNRSNEVSGGRWDEIWNKATDARARCELFMQTGHCRVAGHRVVRAAARRPVVSRRHEQCSAGSGRLQHHISSGSPRSFRGPCAREDQLPAQPAMSQRIHPTSCHNTYIQRPS